MTCAASLDESRRSGSGKDAALDPHLCACPVCDALHLRRALGRGEAAKCARCGATIHRAPLFQPEQILAVVVAALIVYAVADSHPIVGMSFQGRHGSITLFGAVSSLWSEGAKAAAVFVALTTQILPLIDLGVTAALLAVVMKTTAATRPAWFGPLMRLALLARPWSMIEVFVLGVLVALVKLAKLSLILAEPGLWAFVVLGILLAAISSFDLKSLWEDAPDWRGEDEAERFMDEGVRRDGDRGRFERAAVRSDGGGSGAQDAGGPDPLGGRSRRAPTAFGTGRLVCPHCDSVHRPDSSGGRRSVCPRCGARVARRSPPDVDAVLALVALAVILYIPANLLPMMKTSTFLWTKKDTIVGGVEYFWSSGSPWIAALIFFVSIVIPIAKIGILALLSLRVRFGLQGNPKRGASMHGAIEFIGRWSMLDVFVVAVMVGLVQFGGAGEIEAGPAAAFFGGVVVATMLAAQSFDPRLVWDRGDGPAAGTKEDVDG